MWQEPVSGRLTARKISVASVASANNHLASNRQMVHAVQADDYNALGAFRYAMRKFLRFSKAVLAEAELPDHVLESQRVERAIDAFETGVAEDHLQRFLIGLSKPKPPCLFVEGSFRNGLLEHLPIKSKGPGLLHCQRPAELAADLLQPFGKDLAELFGRYFRAPDLGQGRLTESPEDVGDAPNAETHDQDTHHRGHDNFAEPV